jgi:hypothetical protein
MADPFLQTQVNAFIASGTALSAEVDIGGMTLVGIFVPAAWVTAGISFQGTIDGSTFGELVDQTNTAITVPSITGGAALFVALDPAKFRAVRALKVRSGTSGTPVNQTAAGGVTLKLLTRPVF